MPNMSLVQVGSLDNGLQKKAHLQHLTELVLHLRFGTGDGCCLRRRCLLLFSQGELDHQHVSLLLEHLCLGHDVRQAAANHTSTHQHW